MDNELIKNLIDNSVTDESIILPPDYRYKNAVIRKELDGFSWVIELNYKVTGLRGYRFPPDHQKHGYVKTYKSLNVCKKSLYNWLTK